MQRFCEIYEINEINDCYSYGTLILSSGFCCAAAAAKALEINVLVFASAIEPTAGAKPDFRVPALANPGPESGCE